MSALHISYCGLCYYDTMLQCSQQAPTLQRNYYLQTVALYHNADTVLIIHLNLGNCNNSVNSKHWENHRSDTVCLSCSYPSPLHSSSISNLSLSVLYAYLMFLFVSLFFFFVLGIKPSSEALPFFLLLFDFMFVLLQYMFIQLWVPF